MADQYTAYAPYVIWFSDLAEYNNAVAMAGGTGFGNCPLEAANTFGITWPLVGGDLEGQSKGIYGLVPYGIPGPGGVEVRHPAASGVFLESEVDSVLVPGQPGTGSPNARDMLLVWWGFIRKVNRQATTDTPPPTGTYAPIPRRRFVGGFEVSGSTAEGGSGMSGGQGGRIASRVMDGRGLPIRGNNANMTWLRPIAQYIAGYAPKTSWERFYIRINALGTNELGVWKCEGTPTSAMGAAVRISTSGQVLAYNLSLNPDALIATGATVLTLNKWYLVDVLIGFSTGIDNGSIRVYLNHVLEITATVAPASGGLGSNSTHLNSRFGQHTVAEAQWNVDLDDWIGADIPMLSGLESLTSIDWLAGSHVRVVNVLSGSIGSYAGNLQVANQHHNPAVIDGSSLTSSTSGDTIEALTDRIDAQDALGINLGPVGALVGAFSWCAASVNGQIGYGIAGAAIIYSAVAEAAAARWNNTIYRPAGLDLPTTIVPFSIGKKKSADATQNIVYALTAVIEDIGAWGPEDDPLMDDISNTMFDYHNARYADTIYAFLYGLPTAPCFACGGTYVGNGTTQNINLPTYPHFIFIRNTTINGYPIIWHAAGLGGHRGPSESFYANYIIRAWIDSTGQAKFTVAGTANAINAAGSTYQWIAFCDPGSRFNHCGVYHNINGTASADNPLWVNTFLAEAGFIQKDIPGSTTTNTELTYKGPGCGANDGMLVSGAAVANWGSFALGVLTTRASNHPNIQAQLNYSLWRTTDPDCLDTQLQITNYTGDGSGNRTINLPIVTGRYPLFAMVIPHNAVAYWRDPTHAGANSSDIVTGAPSTSHIRGAAAPDTLDVGSGLNANGIVYEVFIILGDTLGWNNGTFWVPNCFSKGPYTLPVYNPTSDPVVLGDGGVNLNGAPGLLLVQDLSGIYTLVPNKRNDTFYERLPSRTSIEEKIPDPLFKTGFIGG